MSLRQAAVTGARWTAVSTLGSVLLQAVQLVVLARMLQPADLGLMAILTAIIAFSQIFIDLGTGNALISVQAPTHRQLSSLYWLNLACGTVMAGAFAALGPLVAGLYGEPELQPLMLLLSGVFILNASGLQYRTLIHKAMQFRHLALAELCGTVVTFCVTVGLATCGHGVWALAWGALAGSVTATGSLLWIGLRHHHRPALTYRHNELSGFYRFGLYQMAEGAVSQIASQADVLIIGKTLGAEAAGVYSIAKTAAQRLISLINPIVTKIALPLMAQLQDDPERLRRAYLRTVSYATLVSYPCFILLAVVAEPFVAIAFGSRWAEATPVLQLLCIYFLIRAAGNPIGSLVLAKGRADLSFRWNALLAVVLPAVVIVGLPWGADGVAAALAVAIVLLRWPSWRMMVHPLCGARFGEYMSNLTRPLALAVVAGAVALPALLLKNDALQIAVAACLASATYVLLLRRFQPVFLADLMTMVLPRQRVQKRSGPPI